MHKGDTYTFFNSAPEACLSIAIAIAIAVYLFEQVEQEHQAKMTSISLFWIAIGTIVCIALHEIGRLTQIETEYYTLFEYQKQTNTKKSVFGIYFSKKILPVCVLLFEVVAAILIALKIVQKGGNAEAKEE